MQKYKLIEEPGTHLKRIVALRNFEYIFRGQRGGLIEGEHNLSHKGNCWVDYNGKVYGQAHVKQDAVVSNYVEVCGRARIEDNSYIEGDEDAPVKIRGHAIVTHDSFIKGANLYFTGIAKNNSVIIARHKSIDEEVTNIPNLCAFNITCYQNIIRVGCKQHKIETWKRYLKSNKYKNLCSNYEKCKFIVQKIIELRELALVSEPEELKLWEIG